MSTGLLAATLRHLTRNLPKLKPALSTSCLREVPSNVTPTIRQLSASSSEFTSGLVPQRSMSTEAPKQTVTIQFIDRDGDSFMVDAEIDITLFPGQNLMKVAHQYDIDLEGACEGTLSCCTCHLVVHPDWFDKLGSTPCEDEEDMLDMAYGLTDTSRLGCQVIVTPQLDGLVVRIPPYEPQYT